jgi:uncharacterized membrane protein
MNHILLRTVLIAGMFAVSAVASLRLPERMPMQYGPDGTPNWYGPTWLGLIDMPLVALLVTLLFWALPKLDARSRRQTPDAQPDSASDAAALVVLAPRWSTSIVLLLACAHVAVILQALEIGADLPQRVVIASVGLLFAVVGNEFGRLMPNRFAGIRTRRLLQNPQAWRATHRFAGRLFFGAGALAVVAAFTLPLEAATVAVIGLLAAAALGSVVYGYRSASDVTATR